MKVVLIVIVSFGGGVTPKDHVGWQWTGEVREQRMTEVRCEQVVRQLTSIRHRLNAVGNSTVIARCVKRPVND